MRTQRVIELRQQRGLTQESAARIAGVSVATWRRLESEENANFRADTLRGIRRALGLSEKELDAVMSSSAKLSPTSPSDSERAWIDDFNRFYRNSILTPRQAASVSATLGSWRDDIDLWISSYYGGRDAQPLWETAPFDLLDLRVLIDVSDNTAWVAAFDERIEYAEKRMYSGIIVAKEPECFADEIIFGLAVASSREVFQDQMDVGTWSDLEAHEHDNDWDYDHIFEHLDWEWFLHGHDLVELGLTGRPPLTWFKRGAFAS